MASTIESNCTHDVPRAERIARLNDELRMKGRGGQIVITRGIRVRLWHSLVEALVEAARRRTGQFLSLERLFVEGRDRAAVFGALQRSVATFRVPLILLRGGIYTVVNGITPSSILLFDARGCCWISKRVCGVPGDAHGARHVVHPASFVALNA